MKKQKGNPDIHPIIQALIPVVKGLATALGPDYELLLHDVSTPEESVVAIENGQLSGRSQVTGRSLGSPMTDFALQVCHQEEYKGKDFICNYVNTTKAGKKIRNNCIMIRDNGGKLVGILCVNYDMTNAEIIKNMVNFLTASGTHVSEESPKESFPKMIDELIGDGIHLAEEALGKPLHLASKAEKVEVVFRLEKDGFFRLDGAIETLAQAMGNTKFTIYAYLREVKERDRDNPAAE